MTTEEQPAIPAVPCTYRFKTDCPNMKLRKNDKDWSGDNYDCAVCGKHVWLDYEEMK